MIHLLLAIVLNAGVLPENPLVPEVCGRNCLQAISEFYQLPADKCDTITALLNDEDGPFSIAQLVEAASAVGLDAEPLVVSDMSDVNLDVPSILRIRRTSASIEPDHFVVCYGRSTEGVIIENFPVKPTSVPWSHVVPMWSGEIVYLAPFGNPSLLRIRNERIWRNVVLLTSYYVGLVTLIAFAWWCMRSLVCRYFTFLPSMLWGTKPHRVEACFFLVAAGLLGGVLPREYLLSLARSGREYICGSPTQSQPIASVYPRIISVKGERADGRYVRTEGFRILNESRQSITIEAVTSSCHCVKVAIPKDTVLEPKQTVLVPVELQIPTNGEMEQTITVKLSNGLPPLTVPVQVSDIGGLPQLFTSSLRECKISHTGEPIEIRFSSREAADSSNWLASAFSDNPDFSCTLCDDVEHLYLGPGMVKRTYRVRITWTPSGDARSITEASGLLRVRSRDLNAAPITVGKISAYERHPSSPAVVVLRKDSADEEVLQLSAADSEQWAVDPSAAVPGWMSVDMLEPNALGQRIKITLNSDSAPKESASYVLPLVLGKSRRTTVPILFAFGDR